MIGKGVFEALTDKDKDEINCLLTHHHFPPTEAKFACVFAKATINGITYFGENNRRVKKRNSYTISYSSSPNTKRYGLIAKFFTVEGHHLAVLQDLIIDGTGPQNGISVLIATAVSQAKLFEDYFTYSIGTERIIFMNQIVQKCYNLSRNGWNLFTSSINDVEIE